MIEETEAEERRLETNGVAQLRSQAVLVQLFQGSNRQQLWQFCFLGYVQEGGLDSPLAKMDKGASPLQQQQGLRSTELRNKKDALRCHRPCPTDLPNDLSGRQAEWGWQVVH